jgi:nitrate reductase molybdenum cofactor assembly chaperone NarJ/NarW
MRGYALLGRLLLYPDAAFRAALPQLIAAVAADPELGPRRRLLQPLFDGLVAEAPLGLEERYVALFDRTPSLSLNLFEHVHGDSRERGQAMVALIELYRRQGLDVTAKELPDYLPLFLEFLSVLPPGEAQDLLLQAAPILERLRQRLIKRTSPYGAIFDLLFALIDRQPAEIEEEGEAEGDSFAAIDRAWEEAAVSFGPAAALDQSCQTRPAGLKGGIA